MARSGRNSNHHIPLFPQPALIQKVHVDWKERSEEPIIVWFRDGHCVDCFLRFPILDQLVGQPVHTLDVSPHLGEAVCYPDRPVTPHKHLGSELRDCLQNMEQSFWIAAAQIGMVPDEEQVAHKGGPFLWQESTASLSVCGRLPHYLSKCYSLTFENVHLTTELIEIKIFILGSTNIIY